MSIWSTFPFSIVRGAAQGFDHGITGKVDKNVGFTDNAREDVASKKSAAGQFVSDYMGAAGGAEVGGRIGKWGTCAAVGAFIINYFSTGAFFSLIGSAQPLSWGVFSTLAGYGGAIASVSSVTAQAGGIVAAVGGTFIGGFTLAALPEILILGGIIALASMLVAPVGEYVGRGVGGVVGTAVGGVVGPFTGMYNSVFHRGRYAEGKKPLHVDPALAKASGGKTATLVDGEVQKSKHYKPSPDTSSPSPPASEPAAPPPQKDGLSQRNDDPTQAGATASNAHGAGIPPELARFSAPDSMLPQKRGAKWTDIVRKGNTQEEQMRNRPSSMREWVTQQRIAEATSANRRP